MKLDVDNLISVGNRLDSSKLLTVSSIYLLPEDNPDESIASKLIV